MLWLLFALLTALFRSLQDVLSKKALKVADVYVVAFGRQFIAIIFLLPVLGYMILTDGVPPLPPMFWFAFVVSGTLNVVTSILYMKAIEASDLSLSLPMLTFTPAFLLLTSPIILGEIPDISGILGVLAIVLGSYLLNASKWREGYLSPFKALLHHTGPKLMLAIAFIWSITSNVDKIGLENSSVLFWALALSFAQGIGLLPIMLAKSKTGMQREHIKPLIWLGLAAALTMIFHMTALSMALVAYVIAIKRLSVLMSVVFGYILFKEDGFRERFVGASFMVAGVVLISVF